MRTEHVLPDPAATDRLGIALAHTRPAHGVILLHGDLGAGKSSLARALLRRAGVQGTIRSPTYTLVERYRLPDGEALHLDLYRIAHAEELDFLGLQDVPAVLWLVEWPQHGGDALPPADLAIHLRMEGVGRAARLQAWSPVGEAWLQGAEKLLDLPALPAESP